MNATAVFALAGFNDGQALYAGREFTTAGGLPASNIARWLQSVMANEHRTIIWRQLI